MPYSKDFNEEKYGEIEVHLSSLRTLPEDKVLVLDYKSPEEAERIRWLFYDYFHLIGVKSLYTAKLFNNFLLVGKVKPSLKNLTGQTTSKDVTANLDKMIQSLILSETPRKAICELVRDEEISFTTLSIILGELGRVKGE